LREKQVGTAGLCFIATKRDNKKQSTQHKTVSATKGVKEKRKKRKS